MRLRPIFALAFTLSGAAASAADYPIIKATDRQYYSEQVRDLNIAVPLKIKPIVTTFREEDSSGFVTSLFLVEHRTGGETKRYPVDIQVRASSCDVEAARARLVETWKNDTERGHFVIDERTTVTFAGYLYRIQESSSGSGTSFMIGAMNRKDSSCYQASVMSFGNTGLSIAATRNVVSFLLDRIESAIAEMIGE